MIEKMIIFVIAKTDTEEKTVQLCWKLVKKKINAKTEENVCRTLRMRPNTNLTAPALVVSGEKYVKR